MVTENGHIHGCCLVCSSLGNVFSMLEVEVHQKKTDRACRNVAARWTVRLVSNRDFASMIAPMGFAHRRSIV